MGITTGFKLIFVYTLFIFLPKQELFVSANPLFFGNLFEPQSTTPESHISDYRSQKRANSEIDINASLLKINETISDDNENSEKQDEQKEMENQQKEQQEKRQRNVEFYADIIGKFVGSVRSSITNFVDAIRMNRQQEQQLQEQKQVQPDAKNQIKNQNLQMEETKPRLVHIQKITTATKSRKLSENHKNEMENSIRMQTIDTLSSTIRTPAEATTKIQQPSILLSEIQFDSIEYIKSNSRFHNESKTNHNLNGKIDEIDVKMSENNSKNNRKRSLKQIQSDKNVQSLLDGRLNGDKFNRNLDNYDESLQSIDDELKGIYGRTDAENQDPLTYNPLSSKPEQDPAHSQPNSSNGRRDKFIQTVLSFLLTPLITPIKLSNASTTDTKQPNQPIYSNDQELEQVNRKIFNLNLSINDNNHQNDTIGEENSRETNLHNDGNKLVSLQLLVRSPTKNYEVNSTLVSPFQALKLFHQRMHNRTDHLHLRTRTALQNAFYRYVRLYLIARRSYKTAKNSGVSNLNSANVNQPNNIQTINSHKKGRQVQLDNDINFDGERQGGNDDDSEIFENFLLGGGDDDVEEMMTNDARINEAFAILILEIIGAIFGLTLGAISQFEFYWMGGSFG